MESVSSVRAMLSRVSIVLCLSFRGGAIRGIILTSRSFSRTPRMSRGMLFVCGGRVTLPC